MNNDFLSNVYGFKRLKEELYTIREWYIHPELLEDRIQYRPHDVLFEGPRGTGTSHMAINYAYAFKDLLGEPFYIDAADDEAVSEIVAAYGLAEKNGKGVIVIDGFDQLVAAEKDFIHTFYDALKGTEGLDIFLIATARDSEKIHERMAFDREFLLMIDNPYDLEEIVVGLSNQIGLDLCREEIEELEHEFRKHKVDDIKLVLQAAYLKKGIDTRVDDVVDELKLFETGLPENSLGITNDPRVGVHEAGHALYIYYHSKIKKFLRIYKTGGGAVTVCKDLDPFDMGDNQIDAVRCGLAGIAAEELIYGVHGHGCTNDLMKVHKMAAEYITSVCRDGLDAYRPELKEKKPVPQFSEWSNKIRDRKVARFVKKQLRETKKLLKKHIAEIKVISAYLVDHNQLTREEFMKIAKEEE